MYVVVAILCLAVLASSFAFMSNPITGQRRLIANTGLTMAAATKAAPVAASTIPRPPDFYWEYRLKRLAEKKGSELPFNPKNYPELKTDSDLYEAYYLDLSLNGKLKDFDFMAEKTLNDNEWLALFNKMADWTKQIAKKYKSSADALPADDFALLKKFYPEVSFREIEAALDKDTFGANFPYKSTKEMIQAAMDGSLKIPGYEKAKVTSIDASETRKMLAAIKEKTMKRYEESLQKALAQAKNSMPDETAQKHYKALKEQMDALPKTPAAWQAQRAQMEKQVDEMARLAAKKVDHHHHHHGDDEHHEEQLSPAQEFEQKYGRSLTKMAERMAQYKADPANYLEKSIREKHGSAGVEMWRKAQQMSEKIQLMSAADKAASEAAFAAFLKKV